MKVQDTSTRALDSVEKETSSSWYRIRDYLDLGSRPPVKEKSRVQPRYCYQALQNVICYPSPIAGQEERLLAYQNSAGTGYTLAPQTEHASPKKKTAKAAEKPPAVTEAPAVAAVAPAPTPVPTAAHAPVQGPVPTATMPEIKPAPTPAPTPASTPAPAAGAQPSVKPEESKKLKEITFDPSELEPKKLVPDRLQ